MKHHAETAMSKMITVMEMKAVKAYLYPFLIRSIRLLTYTNFAQRLGNDLLFISTYRA